MPQLPKNIQLPRMLRAGLVQTICFSSWEQPCLPLTACRQDVCLKAHRRDVCLIMRRQEVSPNVCFALIARSQEIRSLVNFAFINPWLMSLGLHLESALSCNPGTMNIQCQYLMRSIICQILFMVMVNLWVTTDLHWCKIVSFLSHDFLHELVIWGQQHMEPISMNEGNLN